MTTDVRNSSYLWVGIMGIILVIVIVAFAVGFVVLYTKCKKRNNDKKATPEGANNPRVYSTEDDNPQAMDIPLDDEGDSNVIPPSHDAYNPYKEQSIYCFNNQEDPNGPYDDEKLTV